MLCELPRLSPPTPGSAAEEATFVTLQQRLPHLWKNTMLDPYAEQTVVVVPSMSLDVEEMRKLKGVIHYEERMLFLLILLSQPKTRVMFVSSMPIHNSVIDYYLQLLPGVPYSHARQRLQMLAAYDTSIKPLALKILERPALIERIRKSLGSTARAHMTVFNVTPWERQLSVALGVPLYGANPRHLHFGMKSGARKLFRDIGLQVAEGYEDLRDEKDIAESIADLHGRNPQTRRVVVKLNDGFSGDGNGVYSLSPLRSAASRGRLHARTARSIVLQTLPRRIRFNAVGCCWDEYISKFRQMSGVVETFVEGRGKTSPSVQLRVNPLRQVEIISTHDQILGGPDGQMFIGCKFPAFAGYCRPMHEAATAIGKRLAEAGALGRLSVDFLAVPQRQRGQYQMYAVEINLRKGGTTHPFRTLQLLTAGRYNVDGASFETDSGESKHYVASDNLESPHYRGLTPIDLMDITTYSGLHYTTSTNTGVVFHMIGALSEFGKIGVTCIGNSLSEAQSLYDRTVQTLDQQCQTTQWVVTR